GHRPRQLFGPHDPRRNRISRQGAIQPEPHALTLAVNDLRPPDAFRSPRFGPRAVRDQSALIRPWNPVLGVSPFEKLRVADYGDVDVAPISIERTFEAVDREMGRLVEHGVR